MPDIKFNLNEYVKVKLFAEGVLWLKKQIPSAEADEHGYFKLQAWEFMEIFGPTIIFGSTPIFYTEIVLCIP